MHDCAADNDGAEIEDEKNKELTLDFSSGNKWKYAVIKLWPSIDAQFIRIRPSDWSEHIAIRIEFFSPKQRQHQFGRVVTLNTVNARDKPVLMELLKNKSMDTKVIQVDLKRYQQL